MKIRHILALVLFCSLLLTSCVEPPDKEAEKWEKIEKSTRKSEVNLAYYSDIDFENWINEHVAPNLLENKSIHLISEKTKLSKSLPSDKEVQENSSEGKYDILIISAKEYEELNKKGLLYSSFVSKLPNYNKYFATDDYANRYINLSEIQDNALPFYQKQLHFFYNSDLMFSAPIDLEELLEYAKENPGKIAIPAPETEEGKLFYQSVILNFTELSEFMEKDLSRQDLMKLALPGLQYIQSLNNYLYAPKAFASRDLETIDELYRREVLHMSFSMNPMHAIEEQKELEYPDYSRYLQPMELLATSCDYYAVIPVNADNKSGAMVVLNEYLSPSMQRSLYADAGLGAVVLYSKSKMDKALAQELDGEVKKKSLEKASDAVKKKVGTLPEAYWKIILDEWKRMR